MKNLFIAASEFTRSAKTNIYLFKKIWKEHTTALLHASRDIDKTNYALEIISELKEKGLKAGYIDTQKRLTDRSEQLNALPNLYILTPEYESPDDTTDYADLVINAIEEAVRTSDLRIFVVDSVTRIAALSFGRNAKAAYVMKRLVALQVRLGISLLVISHSATRASDRALFNLSDSAICLDIADETTTKPKPTVAASPQSCRASIPTPTSRPQHIGKPLPQAPPMSRQQRRALERKLAKQK